MSDDREPGSYASERPDAFVARAPKRLRTRREKIIEEVRRNREGNHRVPTWVLGVVLLLIVAVYATLITIA